MHVRRFLHKTLSFVIHQKTLDSITVLVSGLLKSKNLSVTGLGRSIDLPIQERSGIKRADRLIGNPHLPEKLPAIYAQISNQLVGAKSRLKIIVDWTNVPNTSYYVLRAGLATQGRAVTLYEETHPQKKLSNVKVEKKFLMNLKKLLPEKSHPIIITDAGFRNPWFKEVSHLGWDFIGRIRGTHQYYDGKQWKVCMDLYLKARWSPSCIQHIDLCKKNRLSLNLFLYKEKAKGRTSKRKYRRNQGGKCYQMHSRSAKEPWLLASSLSGKDELKIKRVIKY